MTSSHDLETLAQENQQITLDNLTVSAEMQKGNLELLQIIQNSRQKLLAILGEGILTAKN